MCVHLHKEGLRSSSLWFIVLCGIEQTWSKSVTRAAMSEFVSNSFCTRTIVVSLDPGQWNGEPCRLHICYSRFTSSPQGCTFLLDHLKAVLWFEFLSSLLSVFLWVLREKSRNKTISYQFAMFVFIIMKLFKRFALAWGNWGNLRRRWPFVAVANNVKRK